MAEDGPLSHLVVIGASAGGVEALSELVSALPEDLPVPIFIAQHLDPGRESVLEEILGRHSPLPVVTVSDEEPLRGGVVFVVPANRLVSSDESHVGPGGGGAGRPMPSVDLLLSTAAEVFGERLVAVVLTGTGSDGTAGARDVHRLGGTVVIQDPETAAFGGMPGSLAPDTVNIVAPLGRIGPLLGELVKGVEVAEGRPQAEERRELARFLEELRERHGVDFRSYKVKGGRLAAVLSFHQAGPRSRTRDEVALIEETADRTWAAAERARAEAAVRESEARLQLALDASEMGTFVWHVEEDRAEPDARMLALFGLPPDGALTLSETLATTIHPDDRAGYEDAVARATDPAGAGALREDVRVVHPDGSVRWLAITARTLFEGAPRRAARMSGVVADVTEQRRAEEALRESEARQAFLLALGDAIGPLTDPIEIQGAISRLLGEHLEVDRACYAEIDEAAENLVVHRDHRRADAPSVAGIYPIERLPLLTEALRTGEPFVISDTGDTTLIPPAERDVLESVEVRATVAIPLVKHGSFVATLLVAQVLPRAWTPAEVALMAEVAERTWDAIERARAEEALRESEERMRLAMETATMFSWEHNVATGSAVVSDNYRDVVGLFDEEPLGNAMQGIGALLAPEYAARYTELVQRTIRGEGDLDHEYSFTNPQTGEVVWIESHGTLVGGEGDKPPRIVGISRNITERKRAEEALRGSEEQYRTLFESIDEGFCTVEVIFDRGDEPVDYRFLETNPAFERMTGLRGAAGKTARELVPDLERWWFETYGRVALTGEPVRFEDRSEAMGRWFDVYASRVGGPGSRRVAIVFQAITERKRSEEHLRRSEERYRAVVEQTGEGIFLFDPRTKRILETNPAFQRMFGYDAEELAQKTLYDLVTHDPEGVDRNVERAMEQGQIWVGERVYRRKDGSRVDVEVSGGVVSFGGERVICSVVRNITERKRSEEHLRRSEERFRAVVQNTSDIITVLEADGTIRYESPAIERVLGYDPDELVGRNAFEYVHPEDLERATGALAEAVKSGASTTVEVRFSRKDGSWCHLEAVGSSLLEDPSVRGIVVNSRDVTERKRAEEEREKLRREAERERARLEAVLQQMPGGVFIVEPSGRFILANEGARRIYGTCIRSIEECGRRTLYYPGGAQIPPEVHPIRRALEGESVSGVEHYAVHADGTRRVVSANAAPVRDERGRVVAAVKAFEDVTVQKAAETALRKSEERLRTVVEGAPVVLCSTDREGVFTLAVGRGHEALGVEPNAAVGRSIFEVFGRNPGVLEDARRALRGETFATVREVRGGVWETSYAPLHDEHGGFAGIIAVAVDVTERERAEEGLRLRDRAIASSSNGIIITDPSLPDNPIIYVNPAFERISGYGAEEILGENCRLLQGEDRDQPAVAELRAAVEGGRGWTGVLRNYKKDGTPFWNELSISPLRDEGGCLTHFVGIQNDVTGRKRDEEERERLRAEVEEARRRLAFFAGAREERQMISRELHDRVAHSMAVVRQFLELHEALKDRSPDSAAAKMEQAKEEAKSALQATRDLSMMLRRSEIEEGLAKAFSELLQAVVPSDVRYEVSVEGDERTVPPHVGNQVFLILREAIRNAVAHSGCGRVRVDLAVTPSRVTGSVEDDGVGVEADGGNGDNGGGGVGLRAMKERAALLGGALRVSSEPGAGTKVQVSVPLRAEDV